MSISSFTTKSKTQALISDDEVNNLVSRFNPPMNFEIHNFGSIDRNCYNEKCEKISSEESSPRLRAIVANDCKIETCTLQRSINYFINLRKRGINKILITLSNSLPEQLAVAKICKELHFECYILYIAAEDNKHNNLVQTVETKYGAIIPRYFSDRNKKMFYVDLFNEKYYFGNQHNGFLSVDDSRRILQEVAAKKYHKLHVMDDGLNDHVLIQCLADSIMDSILRSNLVLSGNKTVLSPARIWIPLTSSELLLALSKIFPNSEFHCVIIGSSPSVQFIDQVRENLNSEKFLIMYKINKKNTLDEALDEFFDEREDSGYVVDKETYYQDGFVEITSPSYFNEIDGEIIQVSGKNIEYVEYGTNRLVGLPLTSGLPDSIPYETMATVGSKVHRYFLKYGDDYDMIFNISGKYDIFTIRQHVQSKPTRGRGQYRGRY